MGKSGTATKATRSLYLERENWIEAYFVARAVDPLLLEILFRLRLCVRRRAMGDNLPFPCYEVLNEPDHLCRFRGDGQ